MKILPILFYAVLICSSCTNGSSSKESQQISSPEQTAREWVEAFYSDNYDQAIALGTDVTRMMIDSVRKEMQPNANIIAFKISNVSCQLNGDSARCHYIYQEVSDQFQEYVDLIQQEGRWLVNESWDNLSDIEQEFENLLEELVE